MKFISIKRVNLVALLLQFSSLDAFLITPSVSVREKGRMTTVFPFQISSTTSSSTTNPTRRAKKTVADRTQAETTSLIRDIIQASIEAGPRAGPARTIQAYSALMRTVQDFMPVSSASPFGVISRNEPETFTAPLALRKLFERMGATYIKLGQFIASSPSLFPKEYVLGKILSL
jgi:aarF domain-containing kinase